MGDSKFGASSSPNDDNVKRMRQFKSLAAFLHHHSPLCLCPVPLSFSPFFLSSLTYRNDRR